MARKLNNNLTAAQKTSYLCFFTYGVVILIYLVMQGLITTGSITSSLKGMLIPICAYIVMAVSLNLTVGILGELSLGHAGFMSVGAFTGVTAAIALQNVVPSNSLRLLIGLVVGAAFAAFAGFLIGIPVLRLKGDYLAIVTLAFGEILRNILQNLYVGNADGVVRFAFSDQPPEWKANIVNGAVGTRIPMDNKIATFLMSFILVLFTLFVVFNIINSKEGRAIKAVRDNRIAAESVGINVTAFRMKAFVISATLAGMAGAMYGLDMTNVAPTKLGYNESINILVFVVLGGLGNILGSVISATVLYILPEIMKKMALEGNGAMAGVAGFVEKYRMLLYAAILIILMICTWSPKVKSKISAFTANIKKLLFGKKKEVGEDA